MAGQERQPIHGMTWRLALPRHIFGSAVPRWCMYLPALSA
jgi:hypothetical protein